MTIVNGHHRPVHRNNTAAHESLPYKMPRSHTDHTQHAAARRSVDSAVSDRFTPSASLPDQQTFDFATPPDMTPQINHTMSSENGAGDGFPFSSGQDVSDPSMDSFDFSQLDDPQLNGFNIFGTSMRATDDSTAPAMPYSGPTSASVSDANLDWSNVDWSTIGPYQDVQPALTYASSNTHSEFGEHTPPDEIGSLFGNHSFMRSMQEMPTQTSRPVQTTIESNVDAMNYQPVNQANRRSLPPSFWTSNPDASSGSSSNASTESLAGNIMAWGQPPSSTPAAFSSRPAPIPRSSMVNTSGRSRPQAVYQKSNTLPGDPGWEQLLQQHQAGNLWGMDDMDEQNVHSTESFANMATKTAISTPMDGLVDSTPDIDRLQRTDSDPQQFFMETESANMFSFADDFSNPGYFSAWPQ